MTFLPRLFAALALLSAFALPVQAQSVTPPQRAEFEKIIREYLLSHPELFQEMAEELEKRQRTAAVEQRAKAIKNPALISSQHQTVLGNPNGDVTMVEFFDYNCGYCREGVADMLELIKADPKLRIVLKEFPVLAQESADAAMVAVAVSMQDKSGKKYLAFHQKLFANRGKVGRPQALAAAKDAGADMARLEKDMAGPDIKAALQESAVLGRGLAINGTPSYVIGSEVLEGRVGIEHLKSAINTARCGKASC